MIAVDITTEVESRSHVERLNEELKAGARAKDEFLAMLAHELRNPLAPIGAAAELLQMMKLDEKSRASDEPGNWQASSPYDGLGR